LALENTRQELVGTPTSCYVRNVILYKNLRCKAIFLVFAENSESINVMKSRGGSSVPSNLLKKSIIIGTDDPLHILKIRFAKGEISKEDYQEMKKLLTDE
jgi:Predicted membrane protein